MHRPGVFFGLEESNTPTIRRGGSRGLPPLPPVVLCHVLNFFHRTLSFQFREVKFFVYMDDIAFVSPDQATTEHLLAQVSELSRILGFRVNSGKTEIYCSSPDPVNESIVWEGIPNKVRPPILQYLGRILAHPNWAHKAQSDYMGLTQSDLAAYTERVGTGSAGQLCSCSPLASPPLSAPIGQDTAPN